MNPEAYEPQNFSRLSRLQDVNPFTASNRRMATHSAESNQVTRLYVPLRAPKDRASVRIPVGTPGNLEPGLSGSCFSFEAPMRSRAETSITNLNGMLNTLVTHL